MKSLEDLKALRDEVRHNMRIREDASENTQVVISMGTRGIANGARSVLSTFAEEAAKLQLANVTIIQSDQHDASHHEPVVEIIKNGSETVTYVQVTSEKVHEIIASHLVAGNVVTEYTIDAQNSK